MNVWRKMGEGAGLTVPQTLAGRLALFCAVMAFVMTGYLLFAEPVSC